MQHLRRRCADLLLSCRLRFGPIQSLHESALDGHRKPGAAATVGDCAAVWSAGEASEMGSVVLGGAEAVLGRLAKVLGDCSAGDGLSVAGND